LNVSNNEVAFPMMTNMLLERFSPNWPKLHGAASDQQKSLMSNADL
jgi:hypothetical protein